MSGFRETPFGDAGDGFLAIGAVLLVVWPLGLAAGQFGLLDVAIDPENWMAWAGTAATTFGAVPAYAYWRQRRLVDDLETRRSGPVTGRAVVEGELSGQTDTLATPVADDPAVEDTSVDPDAAPESLLSLTTGLDSGASDRLTPRDESAAARWYSLSAVRHEIRLTDKSNTTSLGEETRTADPFVVESRSETVDLSGADVSFLQGERQNVSSERFTVEEGRVVADKAGARSGAVRTTTHDAGGDRTAVVAFLARLEGNSGSPPEDGDYEVSGLQWRAAAGERVYVLGEFQRARDGTLVPRGEATVGRGRFERRVEEERDRLQRWRARAVRTTPVGALALAAVSVAVLP